jgi:predicted nucleotidyltransferase
MKAWVFGSQAVGRARHYSDLDLAIDCGRRLALDEAARLSEAFSENDLPYSVDFVDWRSIDEGFRRMVAAGRVPLTKQRRSESIAGGGSKERKGR